MKSLFTIIFFFLFFNMSFAQQDDMINDPGDIAFTSYATTIDGYSFVFMDNCPAGTVITFTDEEWLGAAFSSATSEGENAWTNNTGSTIASGTVIIVQNANDNPSVNIGLVTESESGFVLADGDQMTAFIGTRAFPTVFLASVGEFDCCTDAHTLSGTGLVNGTTAIQLSSEMVYNGSTDCNGTLTECLQQINNAGSWSNTSFPSTVDTQFGGSLLPVDLVSFKAVKKGKTISLNWKTASELNNDFFSIQKSTNGKDFQEIATERGAGTTYEPQAYSYTDERPANGINYYRLKQIDYDGQFAFSEIISVDFRADTDISIAPNPVKDRLNITNVEAWAGTVELLVFAVNGQLVQSAQYDNPDHSITLDIQDLRAGLYHVQVTSNNQTVTQRFVKN